MNKGIIIAIVIFIIILVFGGAGAAWWFLIRDSGNGNVANGNVANGNVANGNVANGTGNVANGNVANGNAVNGTVGNGNSIMSNLSEGCWKDPNNPPMYKVYADGNVCHVGSDQYSLLCNSNHTVADSFNDIAGGVPHEQIPVCTVNSTGNGSTSLAPGCWKDPNAPPVYKINSNGDVCHIIDKAQYDAICGTHQDATSFAEISGGLTQDQIPNCTN